MKLSVAAGFGTVALLLLSAADTDASSQYRNPRTSGSGSGSFRRETSSSRSRRRNHRAAIHDDDYKDDDYHASLSSATWEGGSGYSSSPSLNDQWDLDESSSYSSFYDIEDVKKRSKKKKTKKKDIAETERILLALERGSKEEDDDDDKLQRSKRCKRHKKRKRNEGDPSSSLSSSSSPPKSSKKKKRRRRQKKVDATQSKPKGLDVPPELSRNGQEAISRIKERPLAKRAFVPRTPSATKKPALVSNKATASTMEKNNSSSSSPSTAGVSTGRQTPQPQTHPDRTTWEVPSYSHKISTMMNNKKNGSKSNAPRVATTATATATTALPARSNPNSGSSSRDERVASTARTTAGTITPRTKPTASAATPQSSTLGSSTTPWVRKFLAARPKDRLLPLPRDYISDNFNLAQLPPIVERIGYQAMGDDAIPVAKALQQHRMASATSGTSQQQPPSRGSSYPIYKRALRSILADPSAGVSEDDESSDEDLIIPPFAIQKASEALYLLLHARFVMSPRGLEAIRHVMALDNTVFGKCPRSCCKGTGLLPYGYSNDYTSDASVPTVTTESRKEHDSCCHRYCPSCGEVWISWESKTDGCAWGPSWCHLFLLAFGSQIYAKELQAAAAATRAPQPPPTSTPMVRSFLPRGIGSRGASANNNHADRGSAASEDLSRPTPSVFGFRIHPSTSFGRPFNEPSLRGGSND